MSSIEFGEDVRPSQGYEAYPNIPIGNPIGINPDSLDHIVSSWSSLNAHGSLSGLGADDHLHYLNNTRGDIRYLYKENIVAFTPDADYEPATKKYVDDLILTVDTFLELTDTPVAYTTDGALYVANNTGTSIDESAVILTEAANTFAITKGTASLDIAVGATLNIDTGLQVKTNAGILDFTGVAKTLSIEDSTIVSQDYSSDASPTFAGLTVTNAIDEFSTDTTLGGNSDTALPTEKAVKTYIDTQLATQDTFLELTDTPVNYAGSANKFIRVNAVPDAIVFDTVDWSDLTGAQPAPIAHDFDIHTGDLDLVDIAGYAQGSIIKGGAADWEALVKGTQNYVLKAGAVDIAWGEVAWGEVTGKPTVLDLSNGVNDRIVTAIDADSLNAEENFTFNGTRLAIGLISADETVHIKNTTTTAKIKLEAAGDHDTNIYQYTNGSQKSSYGWDVSDACVKINYGALTNKHICIDSTGKVGINDNTPSHILDVNGTGRFTGILTLDSNLTVTGTGSFGGVVTGITPTAAAHLATKAYVDGVASGLQIKDSCRVATTANVAIATALNNGDTIDDIVLANGDRIFVKSQTNLDENGIYVVAAVPARSADCNTWAELVTAYSWIEEGTANAGSSWVCNIAAGGVLETDDIPVVQFSDAVSYSASDGLDLVGTTFSVDLSATPGLEFNAGDLQVIFAGTGAANTVARSDHTHAIDDLSDATITAVDAGELLKWDGAAWINQTFAELDIATETWVNTNYLLDTTDTFTGTLTVAGTAAATTVTGANVTSGANPGHTHTGASISALDTGDITSGILGVARGGTGIATVGTDRLLTGNGVGALTPEPNLTFDGTTLTVVGTLGQEHNFPTWQMKELDGNANENFQIRLSEGKFLIQQQNDAFDAASTKFTILQNGDIGINDDTPSYKLDVNGTGGFTGILTVASDIIANTYFRSSDGSAVLGTSGAGTVYLRPTAYNNATAQSTFTTTLATVGTNTQVNGTLTLSSHLYQGDDDKHYFGASNDASIFHTGAAGGFYIKSHLHAGQLYIRGESAAGAERGLIHADPEGAVTLFYGGNIKFITTTAGISITGTATASSTMTATNFILSSDFVLKENIKSIEYSSIDDIEIKSFNFKNDEEKRLRYGVIAQDLEKIHPEMVYKNEEGYRQIGYIDFLLAKMNVKDKQIEDLTIRLAKLEELIK